MSLAEKPLVGIKVVDLTYYVAGPGTAKILADWGAEVIKVEPLGGEPGRWTGFNVGIPCEDDYNPYFGIFNSNKRGISLNLKSEEGKKIMDRLLAEANVFVTSLRPGALRRLGLDYETMSTRFPKIIWACVNGFGEFGPDKDKAGFDTVAYWAKSGAMLDLTEKDTSPINPSLAFGDAGTSCSLAGGICAALYKQAMTGKGSKVTIALFAQAIWQLSPVLLSVQHGDEYPKSRKTPNCPLINSYRTIDGEWIFISVLDDRNYPRFYEMVVDHPELGGDPEANNSVVAMKNARALTELIAAEFAKHTSVEMIRRLQEADIAYERIAHYRDVLNDMQALDNNYIVEIAEKNGKTNKIALPPVKIDGIEVEYKYGNPSIGENTAEILQEIGYTQEEIKKMEDDKVIQAYHG